MGKVILHIGQHKTGSSTIQASLHMGQQAGTLVSATYMRSPFRNHSFLIGHAFTKREYNDYHLRLKHGHTVPRGSQVKKPRDHIARNMEASFNKGLPIILSAEDFVTLHPQEVKEMRQWFVSKGATTFQVIGYARDVESWSTSYAGQMVRQGNRTIREVLDTPIYPVYRDYFKKFVHIFGREAVNISPFDRSSLVGGCILADFMSKAGLPKDEVSLRNENSALTLRQLRLASFMTEIYRRNEWTGRASMSKIFPEIAKEDQDKWALPRSVLRKAKRAAVPHVRWCSRTFGIDKAFFNKPTESQWRYRLMQPPTPEDVAFLLHRTAGHGIRKPADISQNSAP